jgi:hypothetical protein
MTHPGAGRQARAARGWLSVAAVATMPLVVSVCRSAAPVPTPAPDGAEVQLTVALDRYDTTTSARESWALTTEMHAVYHLSRSRADTVVSGRIQLRSLQYLSTTPAGTRSHPVTGVPGGPILGFTFTRRGRGAFEIDSVPTSARPRGLNDTQVLEIPGLYLSPPPSACRRDGSWTDSAALPPVPLAGSTPAAIWWWASFRVDSVTHDGIWVAGRTQLRGDEEGPLPTRLRDDRTVLWLLDPQCAVPIRMVEHRRRTLVSLDPETRQPHDSVSATGTASATFTRRFQ